MVLEGPHDFIVEQFLIFRFKINNNKVEYEALIMVLALAKDLVAVTLECWSDS